MCVCVREREQKGRRASMRARAPLKLRHHALDREKDVHRRARPDHALKSLCRKPVRTDDELRSRPKQAVCSAKAIKQKMC
eukprot:6174325-Pleurochrysis_carterae.AAC.1